MDEAVQALAALNLSDEPSRLVFDNLMKALNATYTEPNLKFLDCPTPSHKPSDWFYNPTKWEQAIDHLKSHPPHPDPSLSGGFLGLGSDAPLAWGMS